MMVAKLRISFIFISLYLFIVFGTEVFDSVPMNDIFPRMNHGKLLCVDFEVYGRVQGVFFRKYTQKQAKNLGINGWCMNTERGTVQGQLEGSPTKIDEMKQWLQFTGSPLSNIERVEFRNEKQVLSSIHSAFNIRR